MSVSLQLTQRSTRTDLRDGLSFLSAVQESKWKRSNMDSILMRILTVNNKIESLSKASSGIHFGGIVFEGSIDLNSDHVNGKKERECRPVSGTEPLNITAAATTLESVDRSLLNMQLFASRFITIIAVSQGEFSLSCDMSRYYLKLLEAQVDPQADDVMIWMLRGLSLAGLGIRK